MTPVKGTLQRVIVDGPTSDAERLGLRGSHTAGTLVTLTGDAYNLTGAWATLHDTLGEWWIHPSQMESVVEKDRDVEATCAALPANDTSLRLEALTLAERASLGDAAATVAGAEAFLAFLKGGA